MVFRPGEGEPGALPSAHHPGEAQDWEAGGGRGHLSLPKLGKETNKGPLENDMPQVGEVSLTRFPMALASFKKRRGGKKKDIPIPTKSSIVQTTESRHGQLPEAGRSETFVLIPQPTRKDGLSPVDLIARCF